MRFIRPALLAAGLVLSLPLMAEDRPDHFKGKPANTLKEAVANFSEYNRKLDTLLKKKELAPQDLHDIHVLTYTLENALEKIRADLADLADTLESVHLGSENADVDAVRQHGKHYLDTARQVIR
jgi:CHASE3 domain sensor protein